MEINTDELLLGESEVGCSASHLATLKNQVEILKKMWVWAEETQINPKELKKKLFLTTCQERFIAWHLAATAGNIETLETLWVLSKEAEINTDELLLAELVEG